MHANLGLLQAVGLGIGFIALVVIAVFAVSVVLSAIKDGFVHGTMLQNPYGQGYIGSYAIDKIRGGCTVKADAPFSSTALTDKFIDSGTSFVGPDKVDTYIEAMQSVTKELMANIDATSLDCPA